MNGALHRRARAMEKPMLRAGFVAFAFALAGHAVHAAPVASALDHDRALRDAGYLSLGSILLPISRGLAGDYVLNFRFDPGLGEASFEEGGATTVLSAVQAGSAFGFRLIAATEGEARHGVDAIPFAATLAGPVDPLAVGLLLPAVQTVRQPPPAGGDGPTCEPPPEPVCQAPPGDAPFGPVEWLVFDFAETLLRLELEGSWDFRPAALAFGPNDMALELHYLRRAAVPEPASLALVGASLAALLGRRFRRKPQPS
jgi:hypothetical protein